MRFKIGLSATGKILSLCLLLSFLSAPATCSASTEEPMYLISQSELETLSDNLTKLKANNEQSQSELQNLRNQLATCKKELNEARHRSNELKLRLNELQALSQNQQTSLQSANRLLSEYSADQRRTRLRIKAQRNAWEAVAGLLTIAMAVK